MVGSISLPTDRVSFDSAMVTIMSEHAMLRRLATMGSNKEGFTVDDAISLADAVAAHEQTEARLFELPFLPRIPDSVISTGARVRKLSLDVTSEKNARRLDASTVFAEALLAHVAAEDAWLVHEKELRHERLLKSI